MRDFLLNLDPVLRESYLFGRTPPEMPVSYQPDRYFAATATAAFILRSHRLKGNMQPPLSDSWLPTAVRGDTFRRLLYSMVNQSIDAAHCGVEPQSDLPLRNTKAYESTCLQSDIYFAEAIRTLSISGGKQGRSFLPGVRLITNDASRPLLLQKMQGDRRARTALSLQPVTLQGIQYPAGSIMGVHLACDRQESGRFEPYVPLGEVQKVTVNEVVGVDFLRPSLLMGAPAEREQRIGERLLPGRYDPQFKAAVEILSSWPTQDIYAAAANA